ncbi:MAG: RsmB/NOP family class I SAM-dependent RNA methyltransferase [Planctomycetes bacterium]|nr:RsmB/NOP family class I SAM-dependent RNA methyltransferase [Planctomycetota bacterium]
MSDLERAADRAAAAVGGWLQHGRAPRDLLAHDAALRGRPAAFRAAAALLVREAVAHRRRVEFALGGSAGLAGLAPRAHGAVLVVARLLELRELPVAAGSVLLRQLGGPDGVDFGSLATAADRTAAIAEPVQRLALGRSLPDWAAQRFVATFGADADAVATALLEPPPRTIRANPLRIGDRDGLVRALAAEAVAATPARWAPFALHVAGHADLFATASWARGEFEQQDEASQLGALAVAPPPGGAVLDLCAGTGGKTLALAAALQNRGRILAVDVHERRLAALRERCRRAGVDTVRALPIDDGPLAGEVAAFARTADRVLVDAPCSGTGSWRRRPEGRWAITAADLAELTAVQDTLLDRVAPLLQPGARLVYATCSLLPEENEQRVAAALQRWPQLEPVRLAEILGGAIARPIADATGTYLSLRPDRHGCDGFFAAVLRRRRAG